MKLKLQERHLYGRLVYYPADEESKKLLNDLNETLELCSLPVKKCFTLKQLAEMKSDGHEIEIEPFQYFKDGKHQ